MTYQSVTLQRKDNIIIICMMGPGDNREKMTRLCDELSELCAKIAWDEEVKVVVLTGTGEKSFCISGNVETVSFSSSISKLDQPVIAAIHGDAIGVGLELALACDVRIATEISHFGLPQIEAGLIPWGGGTQRLPRFVGRGKALEMILTGEVIDAKEAYRIGLVNRVVPPEDLMKVTMDLAHEMASKGPISLRYAKEAVNKGMELTLEQGLRLEADLYLLLHTTKDRTEGIQAFREKRSPKFDGK
jgi:enoyl-CoA hydratase